VESGSRWRRRALVPGCRPHQRQTADGGDLTPHERFNVPIQEHGERAIPLDAGGARMRHEERGGAAGALQNCATWFSVMAVIQPGYKATPALCAIDRSLQSGQVLWSWPVSSCRSSTEASAAEPIAEARHALAS
jgi:hypothetical protein